MIPGTGKETARLALAQMGGIAQACALGLDPLPAAKRALKLAERRELVAAGKLPGSSPLPHAVALAVEMVDVDAGTVPASLRLTKGWADRPTTADLTAPAQRALDDTATGAHSLWFNDQGEAFVSFELEEDATLFRLALDAWAPPKYC